MIKDCLNSLFDVEYRRVGFYVEIHESDRLGV